MVSGQCPRAYVAEYAPKCDTWIGRTRVGKSFGSKTVLFAQSQFEIEQAARTDLVPVTRMDEAEGNQVAMDALERILPKYPSCNTFILDRCCAVYPSYHKEKAFKQIKYWSIDTWHAHGHQKKCPCNPLRVRRLQLRLRNVNSSAAEQVFAWFRNYARVLNECSVLRHTFKVLLFAKMHNANCASDKKAYLNAFSAYNKVGKSKSKAYACVNRPAGLLKRPASHR